MTALSALPGQGWLQLGELVLAFVLSALVGLEREIRQKAAGLRTNTLVGVAAALFMLISKHGFDDVLGPRIILDPSRIAAQVVSGIGFIGGGVIFMRRDVVRGLTTAASVWLTAALGMACGAGLPVLAIATVAGHFVIMLGFPRIVRRLRRNRRTATEIEISYKEGQGALRMMLIRCTELRYAVEGVRLDRTDLTVGQRLDGTDEGESMPAAIAPDVVGLRLRVRGRRPISQLVARLAAIEGVIVVGMVEDRELD